MNQDLIKLEKDIEDLENLIEADPLTDGLDEKYHVIEEDINETENFLFAEKDVNYLKKLKNRLRSIRLDIDPFDAEGERKAMFPNGEDED